MNRKGVAYALWLKSKKEMFYCVLFYSDLSGIYYGL